MSDKELWELISIISEGQDSEQRRKVEQYITDLQKEIDRLGKLFYERNEENIRLNNIINELEEYIIIKLKEFNSPEEFYTLKQIEDIHYRLQELKGSDKN